MQKTGASKTLFVGFLVVLLALVFLLLFYLFLVREGTQGESLPLRYTVKIPMVREELSDAVAVGDPLTESAGKREIGQVVAVTRRPSLAERYSESEGRYLAVEVPGFYDLFLTVTTDARLSESAVTVSGYRLAVGPPMYLRLPAFSGVGYLERFEEYYEGQEKQRTEPD
jgi:hypothetical protein